MKLLEITNDFPPTIGGIENYAHSLAKRWNPDDISVITRTTQGSSEFDRGLAFDITRVEASYLWPTKTVFELALATIRERDIDVVHFVAPLPLALLGPRILDETGVPYAVTVNGAEFVLPASLKIGRTALRAVMSRASVLLPYSNFLYHRVRRVFPDGPAVEKVSPGVDLDRFPADLPPAFHSPSQGPVVAYVGRLIARKGALELVRAFPSVLARHPDAHLLIVGSGPEGSKIRSAAEELGISRAVTMTGARPWEEIPAFMKSATLFCHPVREKYGGLETEGFGIVFLEAAAASVASVGGNVGGVRDAIVHGETGLLVDGREPNEIAFALNELLDDPVRASMMGKLGRDRVEESFTWEAFFENFQEAIGRHI